MNLNNWLKSLGLLLAALPALAAAELQVVATSSSTGALVREIGAEQVDLRILAPPDRDLHTLQARPSMIRDLRGADLVVSLGAELEGGWLPPAIQQAANPGIIPGEAGYFEAAAQVALLDAGGPADRALGDVHPTGNPHIQLDPLRMAGVGEALAERLAILDPAHAADYRRRADDFRAKVEARMPGWQARAAGSPGVIAFHKDLTYLLERFDVDWFGTLEPVPGVPPTGAHIKALIDRNQGREGLVLLTVYQPEQAAERVAAALGWPIRRLPLEPPLDADGDAYLLHIERWIGALLP